MQDLISEGGERYMLVSAFGNEMEQYDVNEVDGFSGMPLPKGYAYESREIMKDR
ncbi:MAG: hypothetical protein ACXWT1_08545 [Methylobacter sp.]